ncbi:MAG: mandelate racemase/muconate lactonizing enzyme family protein [Atribacterota bacterium]|nr:mandelate racemase/muconate lactonizing enzyme family protein [Atribacterota bacterium]MDD4896812.1 mandelate racemase/muconate lactonizing enzyme family protein [Atribacterota bacterium]MDD5659008.1 mandelate racemase/muconate lactonizing enzyme family protein [Actinomycetota bacterium]
MKITKMEIYPISVGMNPEYFTSLKSALGPWSVCRYIVIKMYTNEGVIGLGEVPPVMFCSREGQSTITAVIKDYLAPLIIGKDPFNIEEIWKEMDKLVPGSPLAKSPIDIALYDILGKVLNVPICKLLGGIVRERIPLTGVVGYDESINNMIKLGEKWMNQGYKSLRFKIGRGLKKDEELLKAIRKDLGEEVKIRADVNQVYTPDEAVKVVKTLEKYDMEAIEQPVPWYDIKGLSLVNKSSHIPIMPHESLYNIHDAIQLINNDAISLFGLKMYRPGGGLSNALKVRTLSELYDIPCTIISCLELGVSTAASMQFASTIKRLDFACEATGPVALGGDVVKNPIIIKEGYAEVPQGIGIGVELDKDKLKKYSEGIIVCDETLEVKS